MIVKPILKIVQVFALEKSSNPENIESKQFVPINLITINGYKFNNVFDVTFNLKFVLSFFQTKQELTFYSIFERLYETYEQQCTRKVSENTRRF